MHHTPKVLLLFGLLSLAACGPNPTPSAGLPVVTGPVQTQAPLGLYELSVAGLDTARPQATVKAAGLHAQAAEIAGLRFAPVSFSVSTDETTRTRYLRASFNVTNASGQNITLPTYIPVDTDGLNATVGTTPFKNVLYYDGSDASVRAADLKLDTARRNGATGANEVDPNATPLVQGIDTSGLVVSVPAGTTFKRAFSEGWQGGALAAGGTQVVTFAMSFPMAADPKLDPFKFDLVFTVSDNPARLPAPVQTGDLRISEISSNLYLNSSGWVEVFNGTGKAVNLAEYQLRAHSTLRVSPYTYDGGLRSFPLPNVILQPGEYVLISGKSEDTYTNSTSGASKRVYLTDGNWIPQWFSRGFIELTRNSATVDVVRFGVDNSVPLTPTAWKGNNVPDLDETTFGRALSRDVKLTDSDTASDWVMNEWMTPFGPNNVPQAAADLDRDGIPDVAELPGSRYGALDVYGLGARQNQRDIFLEIDYMPSADPGTTPRQEALDKVVAAFARRGFALHIDTGSLYGSTHNLGGGNSMPFVQCARLGATAAEQAAGCVDLYQIKGAHQDPARNHLFHYAVFANKPTLDDSLSYSGIAEVAGNDILITLGGLGLSTTSARSLQYLINQQASTLMHELGHNLNLLHGGFEGVNYKPNYFSIMNYLYDGLPGTFNQPKTAQYWLLHKNADPKLNICTIDNSPCNADFILDYSDGSSASLSETALNEHGGMGRGAFDIDWNLDGKIGDAAVTADINSDGKSTGEFKDHDDWANLVLSFTRHFSGIKPRKPLRTHGHNSTDVEDPEPLLDAWQNDRQTVIVEEPLSQAQLDAIRNLR